LLASSYINPLDRAERRLRRPTNRIVFHREAGVFFGYLAGLASTMAHAGGMVMSIYMLQADTPKRRFVGTFVIFSFATNLIKLFTYFRIGILSGDMVTWMAAMAPLIICGGFFGNFLNHRIPQELFRNLIMVFILAIGLWVASTA
jgi:uncharacterized membrane protein YfcA